MFSTKVVGFQMICLLIWKVWP